MMKIEGIAAFVAVAEAGSISEAARRLRLSKSVVSERVAELERGLNATLLHRTTRKLTLTEDTPPLKPYEEGIWAELVDGKTGDPAVSLGILDGVHHRLHRLLTTLDAGAFARTAHHPQHGAVSLDWLLQLYAWHGRHHISHLGLIARA